MNRRVFGTRRFSVTSLDLFVLSTPVMTGFPTLPFDLFRIRYTLALLGVRLDLDTSPLLLLYDRNPLSHPLLKNKLV